MNILILALMLSQVEPNTEAQYAQYNEFTKFDRYFSKYSKRYFGIAFDWHYFKAQDVAESSLQTDAESPAGAVGIMQIMPSTFADIRERHPAIKGPLDSPRWNIAAGIWYDRQNYVSWSESRPFDDRLKFMFGSYNAGRGNILQAQRKAQDQGLNANLWQSIEKELPSVTGRHSRETLTYVSRIFNIKRELR
mgnify:CR=1 FL=1